MLGKDSHSLYHYLSQVVVLPVSSVFSRALLHSFFASAASPGPQLLFVFLLKIWYSHAITPGFPPTIKDVVTSSTENA